MENKKIKELLFLSLLMLSTQVFANTKKYDDIGQLLNGVNAIENGLNKINGNFNATSNAIKNELGNFKSTINNTFNFEVDFSYMSSRRWRRSGGENLVYSRFDGARQAQLNQLANMGTNIFVVSAASGLIEKRVEKIVSRANEAVKSEINRAVDKAVSGVEEKVNNAIYKGLGIEKINREIDKAIAKVKETDKKVNDFILTGTDQIGKFKKDIETLRALGVDIQNLLKDDDGNILVRVYNISKSTSKMLGVVNKYARNESLGKGLNSFNMYTGYIDDWDMILEQKLRQTINLSRFELGYLLENELLALNDFVKNNSYYFGKAEDIGKVGKTQIATSVPVGNSTPDIAKPFRRYNPDKLFLENNTLGFSNESDTTSKKYNVAKNADGTINKASALKNETKDILIDNFKSVVEGKPKDATTDNTVGYTKPKIGKDSTQKYEYSNAPFVFDKAKDNVSVLKAIPRVQAEKILKTEAEATKLNLTTRLSNMMANGENEVGLRAEVDATTTTNALYTAVFKHLYKRRRYKVAPYNEVVNTMEQKGRTNPILLSNALMEMAYKTEQEYLQISKDGAEIMQLVYDEQMNEQGTTQLAGFEKDELKVGRTPESDITLKAKSETTTQDKGVKPNSLNQSGNPYLLGEDSRDYIVRNQEKRKETFKQRAEIEKIANFVKNEHNAFRDWQNAYYNNKVFEIAIKRVFGNSMVDLEKEKDPNKKEEKETYKTRAELKEKTAFLDESFKLPSDLNDKERLELLLAKQTMDNLVKRRFMVVEQLNRNLGNQGARFKTMLDAVEYVKKHLDESEKKNDKGEFERTTINLKRIVQAMALINSQTREEIGLITKNLINSKRTKEIEELVMRDIDLDLKLEDLKIEKASFDDGISKRQYENIGKTGLDEIEDKKTNAELKTKIENAPIY